MEFIIGGLAATAAGFFTNPLEVLKIRMQLQGELKAKGNHVVIYKNTVQAAYQIFKHEGVFALQKGLVPALWVQMIMNGCRLGFFDFWYRRAYVTRADDSKILHRYIITSGTGGVIGHYLSNPFYLIKTHRQSESIKAIAVGHQHKHQSTWTALKNIFKTQGLQGLFRGGFAVIPRAFVASSSQLMAFMYSKDWLNTREYFSTRPLLTTFVGSLLGGVAISVMTAPFDLILVRLYNQGLDSSGKGLLYNGYFDCVLKIYRTEGLRAFYKGVGPMYFRLGPHTVLCLVFWDVFREYHNKLSTHLHH